MCSIRKARVVKEKSFSKALFDSLSSVFSKCSKCDIEDSLGDASEPFTVAALSLLYAFLYPMKKSNLLYLKDKILFLKSCFKLSGNTSLLYPSFYL